MKTLLKRIDALTEKIEMGFLTYKEGMAQIRNLWFDVLDKYEEGSDEAVNCKHYLYDAQTALEEVCCVN